MKGWRLGPDGSTLIPDTAPTYILSASGVPVSAAEPVMTESELAVLLADCPPDGGPDAVARRLSDLRSLTMAIDAPIVTAGSTKTKKKKKPPKSKPVRDVARVLADTQQRLLKIADTICVIPSAHDWNDSIAIPGVFGQYADKLAAHGVRRFAVAGRRALTYYNSVKNRVVSYKPDGTIEVNRDEVERWYAHRLQQTGPMYHGFWYEQVLHPNKYQICPYSLDAMQTDDHTGPWFDYPGQLILLLEGNRWAPWPEGLRQSVDTVNYHKVPSGGGTFKTLCTFAAIAATIAGCPVLAMAIAIASAAATQGLEAGLSEAGIQLAATPTGAAITEAINGGALKADMDEWLARVLDNGPAMVDWLGLDTAELASIASSSRWSTKAIGRDRLVLPVYQNPTRSGDQRHTARARELFFGNS